MQNPRGIETFTEAGAALKLPDISDSDIASLVQEIDHTGFAILPSYIDDATLKRLRQFAIGIVDGNGGEYVVLTGLEEMAGTLLEAIGATPAFINLMHRVYEKGCSSPVPTQSLYQVLRCVSGKSGLSQAYFFHYDSYIVTALLPIIIPQEGQTGDLVMKPNHRRVRGSYISNLIDKLFVDSPFAQKYFRRQAESRRSGFTRIRIVPGNLYLFWGYRSLHANAPCDPQKIRATALFHFGDPYADGQLRKLTGRAKIRATSMTA